MAAVVIHLALVGVAGALLIILEGRFFAAASRLYPDFVSPSEFNERFLQDPLGWLKDAPRQTIRWFATLLRPAPDKEIERLRWMTLAAFAALAIAVFGGRWVGLTIAGG